MQAVCCEAEVCVCEEEAAGAVHGKEGICSFRADELHIRRLESRVSWNEVGALDLTVFAAAPISVSPVELPSYILAHEIVLDIFHSPGPNIIGERDSHSHLGHIDHSYVLG